MYGAAIGDMVGAPFEFKPIKTTEFEFFHQNWAWTDDTVMTVALADALLHDLDIAATMRKWGKQFIGSYGLHFWDWLCDPRMGPYGSYGNGSSMRVSAAAWLAHDLAECLDLAKRSAEVSHNHPEGIRGAQATAAAIYAGLAGMNAPQIRRMVEDLFGYDLSATAADIRPKNEFEVKSWISIPQALICAFEATSFEEAVRLAVSLGGDADTQAAIAGSVAETMFPVPEAMLRKVVETLPSPMSEILHETKQAAGAIVRRPVTRNDLDRIKRWDPKANADWDEAMKKKFATQDPPGYAEEMAKIETMFAGTHAPRKPTAKGWVSRLFGR